MEKSFNMIVLKKISIYAKTEVFTITKGLITKKEKKKSISKVRVCRTHYKLSVLKFS